MVKREDGNAGAAGPWRRSIYGRVFTDEQDLCTFWTVFFISICIWSILGVGI